MKRVIITGSTGMVGKGVLLECLDDVNIEKVLVINRSTLNIQHSKLEEVLLKDFSQLTSIKDKLISYDACFFCMGISSVGMNEEKYTQITFNIVKVFADVLHKTNPNMVFNYVSGTGTDSSENGSSMWARVKGKTENYIFNKGFKDAYAFRPGAIIPEKGIKSRTNWYSIIYILLTPFFGLMKKSKNITTTTKIGLAMINSLHHTQTLKHLENKDINVLAEKLS
ncbi:NAD-dependent epimerase/dehydratase family protein [Tenacibaculum aiptasiae]|uniref:NAD-dependent epimerase/dehydratase family protein n=1 Tax=Tenacibaculum aiptasiae TaxID=426481 RepID=UPI00232D73C9|nr:NAD-dependent epimerase/dehydratase family protein [Tenacibaculum aiptasiae]